MESQPGAVLRNKQIGRGTPRKVPLLTYLKENGMEIFALLVLFGMGQEINKNIDNIENLTTQVELQDKWIRDLENHVADIDSNVDKLINDYIRLGAMHASHAARSNTDDEKHDAQIEKLAEGLNSLRSKTDYLDEKITTLHP